MRYMDEGNPEDGHGWQPTGSRTIRARSATNRILTLTNGTLDEAHLEEDPVAFFAREGEIQAWLWGFGIPAEVAETHVNGEEGYLACGVREIHTSGTSTVVTLTEDALGVAGFTEGTEVQQWSKKGGIKLTTDGPDVSEE